MHKNKFRVDIEITHREDGHQRSSCFITIPDDEVTDAPYDDVRGAFWNDAHNKLMDAGFVDPQKVLSVRLMDIVKVAA